MSLKTITQEELDIRVLLHGKWLRGEEGGERLVLVGYDLSATNLSYCNLSGANLSYCNLSGANLRYCNLSGANLRGTKLRFANLRGADLRGAIGIVLLPVQDMRGYSHAHAVLCGDEWRIRAGCWDFSITQARKNWGQGYPGDREQADMYLCAIDWLEGWIERHGHEHMEKAA